MISHCHSPKLPLILLCHKKMEGKIILKICLKLFYLKESQRQKYLKYQKYLNQPWFTPTIITMVIAGPIWSQEPKSPSGSPKWMSGIQVLEPTPTISQGVISRKLNSEAEQGLKTGCPRWHARIPRGALTAVIHVHPRKNAFKRPIPKVFSNDQAHLPARNLMSFPVDSIVWIWIFGTRFVSWHCNLIT